MPTVEVSYLAIQDAIERSLRPFTPAGIDPWRLELWDDAYLNQWPKTRPSHPEAAFPSSSLPVPDTRTNNPAPTSPRLMITRMASREMSVLVTSLALPT